MSNAATTAATLSATFGADHGANKTLVFASPAGQPLVLPPSSGTGPVPPDFSYVIPLQTSFQYDGSTPLCFEIESIPTVSFQIPVIFDGFSHPDNDPPPYRQLRGTGCTAAGRSGPMTIGSFGTSNGRTFWPSGTVTFSLTWSRAPVLAPGAFLLGLDDITFAIAGTASGTSGMCSLYTTPLLTVPTAFGVSGTGKLAFTTALYPSLHGTTIAIQAVASGVAANSTGVVTSDAASLHLTAPFGPLPVGSVTGYVGSVSGNVLKTKGVIVRFR